MKNKLSLNWVTEGHIDFEYKKYLLLAYLQEVGAHFDKLKLYPALADVLAHYQNLNDLKEQKLLMREQFPKRMTQIDWQKLEADYEELIKNDALMEEIAAIVDYALPKLTARVKDGKELYNFAEEHMIIQPVGVIPVYSEEGYLLLRLLQDKSVDVYRYVMTLFEDAQEQYRSLKTSYVGNYNWSITTSYQSIKYDLIKSNKELPNPATYAVECAVHIPYRETMYPIAKRLLLRELSV